jgi:uncharacterized protein YbjT (DUF2867 family)
MARFLVTGEAGFFGDILKRHFLDDYSETRVAVPGAYPAKWLFP